MRTQPSAGGRTWSLLSHEAIQPTSCTRCLVSCWGNEWATRPLPTMSGTDHKFNAEPNSRLSSHHRLSRADMWKSRRLNTGNSRRIFRRRSVEYVAAERKTIVLSPWPWRRKLRFDYRTHASLETSNGRSLCPRCRVPLWSIRSRDEEQMFQCPRCDHSHRRPDQQPSMTRTRAASRH
jgi:hypothetical protein